MSSKLSWYDPMRTRADFTAPSDGVVRPSAKHTRTGDSSTGSPMLRAKVFETKVPSAPESMRTTARARVPTMPANLMSLPMRVANCWADAVGTGGREGEEGGEGRRGDWLRGGAGC